MHDDYSTGPELNKFKTTLNEFNQFIRQYNACLLGKPLMNEKKTSKDTIQNVTITDFGKIGFTIVGKEPNLILNLMLLDSKGNFVEKTTLVDIMQHVSKHVTIPIGTELENLASRVKHVEVSLGRDKTLITKLQGENKKLTSKNFELKSEVARTSPFNPDIVAARKKTKVYENKPSFGTLFNKITVIVLMFAAGSIATYRFCENIDDFWNKTNWKMNSHT